jgi:hypothetical protein
MKVEGQFPLTPTLSPLPRGEGGILEMRSIVFSFVSFVFFVVQLLFSSFSESLAVKLFEL